MSKPTVIFKREEHRNQSVLSLYMPKDDALNRIAKSLNAKYSVSKKMWHLPFAKDIVNKAFKAYQEVAWVDYSAIKTPTRHSDRPKGAEESNLNKKDFSTSQASVEMTKSVWTQAQKDAMWAYADKLRIRKYSESTYRTYGVYFKQFLAAHPNIDPKDISEEQIITHVIKTVKQHNYATKTQNQIQPVGFAP